MTPCPAYLCALYTLTISVIIFYFSLSCRSIDFDVIGGVDVYKGENLDPSYDEFAADEAKVQRERERWLTRFKEERVSSPK